MPVLDTALVGMMALITNVKVGLATDSDDQLYANRTGHIHEKWQY